MVELKSFCIGAIFSLILIMIPKYWSSTQEYMMVVGSTTTLKMIFENEQDYSSRTKAISHHQQSPSPEQQQQLSPQTAPTTSSSKATKTLYYLDGKKNDTQNDVSRNNTTNNNNNFLLLDKKSKNNRNEVLVSSSLLENTTTTTTTTTLSPTSLSPSSSPSLSPSSSPSLSPSLSPLLSSDSYSYHGNVTNRWEYKLGKNGGTIFFKHLRKAGGSSVLQYFANAIKYHYNQTSDDEVEPLKWYMYHQEWAPMAWDCPIHDFRWNTTLSVIVLRSPIDRQLSEFFYSGPGAKEQPLHKLSKDYIMKNVTLYENNWTLQMEYHLPKWIQDGIQLGIPGRNFQSEYQTKMLSGISTKTKPLSKNRTTPYTSGCLGIGKLNQYNTHHELRSKILNYTGKQLTDQVEDCDKTRKPCYYGGDNKVWGGGTTSNYTVTETSLEQAKRALNEFDLILLTETLSEPEQAEMVSNIVYMPESFASLKKKVNVGIHSRATTSSSSKKKKPKFEGYKSLLKRKAPHLYEMLEKHTYYDNQLYEYAKELNKKITEKWRQERGM